MQINHAKAFAYAKFSDRREKSRDDDSDSGKGSSAAKRAAMEETIDDGQDKKKRGRKVYENPTNKVSLKTATILGPQMFIQSQIINCSQRNSLFSAYQ